MKTYHLNKDVKNIIWSVEQLENLLIFYTSEYSRTSNIKYLKRKNEIQEYLNQYKNIMEFLKDSSTELKLFYYIFNGLNVTKAVEKVAEENYLNDKKPNSVGGVWLYYKNLKEKLQNCSEI